MSVSLSIRVPKELYIKDPETTDLGKMIVSRSIPLMLELGFDKFTFKKLGAQIKSPEASVYRYFSSKHQLLNYLTAWYWNWLTYLLLDRTRPITDPKKRLKAALTVLLDAGKMDISIPHVDESLLHKVILREGAKAESDGEEKGSMREVLVAGHEIFCEEFAKVIRAYKKSYPHPKALVVSLTVVAHRLIFMAENSPTSIELKTPRNDHTAILKFLEHLLFAELA